MKKIILIIGGILGLIIVISLIAGASSSTVKESFEKGQQQGKEMIEGNPSPAQESNAQVVYTLNAEANVTGNNKIEVKGTTNLPNGTILDVTANRMVVFKGESEEKGTLEGRGTSKASVFDGAFTTNVSLIDGSFAYWLNAVGDEVSKVTPNVTVKVVLDPKRSNPAQDTGVLQAIGANGEQLTSSPNKKVFGERTNTPTNQLETELLIQIPYSR